MFLSFPAWGKYTYLYIFLERWRNDRRRICIFFFFFFVGGNESEGRIKIENTSNHEQATVLFPARVGKLFAIDGEQHLSPVVLAYIASSLYLDRGLVFLP